MATETTLSQISRIVSIAGPVSVGMLINMISTFIAMAMVAELGKTELAAAALAIPPFITILTFFSAIFYALSILIRDYKAQGKTLHEIGNLIKNGFFLVPLFFIPAGFMLLNIDRILLIFGQDPVLVSLTYRYLAYAALGMISSLFSSVIFQIFLGIGKPHILMFTSMCTLLPTIFLSWGLILGKAGLPQMGLAGVSCTVFIVQSLACIALMIYMTRQEEIKKYAIFSGSILPDWSSCKKIISQGLPIGIQFAAELAVFAVSAWMIGYFGIAALAAAQISAQYSMLMIMISLGISQALSVLTSEAYATGNVQQIREYIIAAMYIVLAVFLILAGILICIPQYLIGIFINVHDPANHDLIHLALYLLIVAMIIQFFDTIRNALSGSLRGMQDSKTPMNIGISCLWLISIPVGYLVGFNLNGGPVGLRIGFTTGFVVAIFLLWVRIKNKIRIHASTESS